MGFDEQDGQNEGKSVEIVKEELHSPMELDVKKEREEGELEEGELPDTKINSINAVESAGTLKTIPDFSSELSVPFTPTQIRQLFKLLPESSLMGAEVSRTFSQLCNKAILHKKIY